MTCKVSIKKPFRIARNIAVQPEQVTGCTITYSHSKIAFWRASFTATRQVKRGQFD
jgi:hypothetical protein